MAKMIAAFLLALVASSAAHAQSAFVNYTTSSAVASNLVACPQACNLYSGQVSSGASAGFLMFFNATAAPADGAVTPVMCINVAANSTVALAFATPIRFATGLVAVFSTTGCFTKTASATATFAVGAQ